MRNVAEDRLIIIKPADKGPVLLFGTAKII